MVKLKPYWVYILQCADNTLYTGITTDIESRIHEHNIGHGAKYTRGRIPVKLVYSEVLIDKSSALKRENQIKKQTRKAKLALIAASDLCFNPQKLGTPV